MLTTPRWASLSIWARANAFASLEGSGCRLDGRKRLLVPADLSTKTGNAVDNRFAFLQLRLRWRSFPARAQAGHDRLCRY